MNFYHSWIYEHILNAYWFVWTIVIVVFTFNFLGPILIWFRINSKPLPFFNKKQQKENGENSSTEN